MLNRKNNIMKKNNENNENDFFDFDNSSFEIEADFNNIDKEIQNELFSYPRRKNTDKISLEKKDDKVIEVESANESFLMNKIDDLNLKNDNVIENPGDISFISDISYDISNENIIKIHEYLDNDNVSQEILIQRLIQLENTLDKIIDESNTEGK